MAWPCGDKRPLKGTLHRAVSLDAIWPRGSSKQPKKPAGSRRLSRLVIESPPFTPRVFDRARPRSPRRLHRLLPLRRRVLRAVRGSARRTRKAGRFQRLWDRFATASIAWRSRLSLPALTNSQDVARSREVASPRLRRRQERAQSPAGAHAGSEPRGRDHGSCCRRRCASQDDALDGAPTPENRPVPLEGQDFARERLGGRDADGEAPAGAGQA